MLDVATNAGTGRDVGEEIVIPTLETGEGAAVSELVMLVDKPVRDDDEDRESVEEVGEINGLVVVAASEKVFTGRPAVPGPSRDTKVTPTGELTPLPFSSVVSAAWQATGKEFIVGSASSIT
jgi:hypothetical protein